MIGATRNWARGVTLWNIALDQDSGPTNGGCMGCRGVVTIDTRTAPATIMRNVEYYALGQLSRFASGGARRHALLLEATLVARLQLGGRERMQPPVVLGPQADLADAGFERLQPFLALAALVPLLLLVVVKEHQPPPVSARIEA